MPCPVDRAAFTSVRRSEDEVLASSSTVSSIALPTQVRGVSASKTASALRATAFSALDSVGVSASVGGRTRSVGATAWARLRMVSRVASPRISVVALASGSGITPAFASASPSLIS